MSQRGRHTVSFHLCQTGGSRGRAVVLFSLISGHCETIGEGTGYEIKTRGLVRMEITRIDVLKLKKALDQGPVIINSKNTLYYCYYN